MKLKAQLVSKSNMNEVKTAVIKSTIAKLEINWKWKSCTPSAMMYLINNYIINHSGEE